MLPTIAPAEAVQRGDGPQCCYRNGRRHRQRETCATICDDRTPILASRDLGSPTLPCGALRGGRRWPATREWRSSSSDKTASLWRSFHDPGSAIATREAERRIRFEVTDYPELPERMRETIVGWLGQAVELTGAQNVAVVKSDTDPERWTWTVTWR